MPTDDYYMVAQAYEENILEIANKIVKLVGCKSNRFLNSSDWGKTLYFWSQNPDKPRVKIHIDVDYDIYMNLGNGNIHLKNVESLKPFVETIKNQIE